jgi:hypothetical protein
MRTISESLKARLLAQAEEAKTLGLQKIASQLEISANNNKTRKNDEFYSYDYDQLKNDVESSLWYAALRTQDFFDKTADGCHVGDLIEDFAEDFIHKLRVKIGGTIGANENLVAGQSGDITDIEISDEVLNEV